MHFKTRLFATNSIWTLHHVDRIIMLKNGEIVEMGSLEELMSLRGEFARFFEKYEYEEKQKTADANQKEKATGIQENLLVLILFIYFSKRFFIIESLF